jgi:hypothetical protein
MRKRHIKPAISTPQSAGLFSLPPLGERFDTPTKTLESPVKVAASVSRP